MKLKDIPQFEGLYAATTDGRIWSYPKGNSRGYGAQHGGKFLKPALLGKGYLRVQLGKGCGGLVHRFVALTFIPNPKGLPQVNHLNGIKSDNRVENLEWCDNAMNMRHAIKTGLYDLKGESHPNSKLDDKSVKLIRAMYKGHALHAKDFSKYPRYKEVAKRFNVTQTLIGQVVRNEIWQHV